MIFPQMLLDLHGELIVDLFAGGGGASCGIEMALGRTVDLAINHDAAAVALHQANHPQTRHFVSDVFEVDPREVTQGRRVGLLWASPDCTFHSKARGGKPIRSKERKRRALAWVVTRWAGQVRPRVIMLENVEEFAEWGPLVGPPHAQRPCPRRRGRTFRKWVRSLERLGYQVEWRELRACDYGAPTIRRRLFLIARCDGRPIVWPEATHGPGTARPYRTAAECIDWSIPMLSIFATREEARAWGKTHGQAPPVRPLAEATQRRIARGVMRYVVQNPEPYIVGVGARRGQSPERGLREPMHTAVAKGDAALVAPVVVPNNTNNAPHSVASPVPTVTGGGRNILAAPVLVRNQTGDRTAPARSVEDPAGAILAHGANPALVVPYLTEHANATKQRTFPADEPLRTQVADVKGGHFSLVAPYLVPRYGERDGQEPRVRSVEEPAPVIVPTGNGGSLAAVHLSPYHAERRPGEARGSLPSEPAGTLDTSNRHALVAGFLAKHFGGVVGSSLQAPKGTVTTIDHDSLVAASLVKNKGTSSATDPAEPLHTIVSGGTHHGLVAANLTHFQTGEPAGGSVPDEPLRAVLSRPKAGLVYSFLQKYYGSEVGQDQDLREPAHTVPTRDRFGLVTVEVAGEPYVLADIAMRMLQPRELYRAQGFPTSYIIDRGADGRRLTKTEQVRMCGNSVCPPIAAALARANVPELIVRDEVLSHPPRRRTRRKLAEVA